MKTRRHFSRKGQKRGRSAENERKEKEQQKEKLRRERSGRWKNEGKAAEKTDHNRG